MGAAFASALLRAPADSRRPPLDRDAPAGAHRRRDLRAHRRPVRVASSWRARCSRGSATTSLAAHQIAFQLFVVPGAGARRGRDRRPGDRRPLARRRRRRRRLRRRGAHDRAGRSRSARVFGAVMLALIDVLPARLHRRPGRDRPRAGDLAAVRADAAGSTGAVFALDGILIGAGDTRFLMWWMLVASRWSSCPIALASLAFDWGIVGVWCGLLALIAGGSAPAAGASEDGGGPFSARPGSRHSLGAASVDLGAAALAPEALVHRAAAVAMQDQRRRPRVRGEWRSPHFISATSTGQRSRPLSVSRYSWRGGRSW